MNRYINESVKEIQISGIRKFAQKIEKYDNVIALTLGQPDFPTPAPIKEAAIHAINQNQTVYTPNAGLPALRNAASNFLKKKYSLSYDPTNEVIVTVGASQALDVTFRTILNDECEVILPAPIYPGYAPIIQTCGAKPVFVDTSNSGFKITPELLEEHITEKTRCIVLPYPNNPTGVTLTKEELENLANYLSQKDVFILSDEIYSELTYDTTHTSIASYPGMREKTIVINGLSKSHSMTGWRIGFIYAPAYLAQEILKVHQYNVSCATSISQYAAITALTDCIDSPIEMAKEYKIRRNYMIDRLEKMGLPCIKPEGAFYLFPSIKEFNMPSMEFALNLVEKHNLAVIPGEAFSEYGDSYIRLSYAYSMKELEIACDRLEEFVTSLRN
ncbi:MULTISPECIES: aminotransferase A [Bacillaceae]|uniref:aminotransferase A n=1 Tax=Bacillaceae TaxID=186817 RepID=UPI000BECBB35|nr:MULTISPECIES: aminotransferase A [unclassified Bacillus (in: firmicutes)]PEC49921.1 aromatic amino acid aminotransferase [Bacillus sp. AFS096315]PFM79405.1 aromatic amino acid aminotransferase [Bacillus sp. AFS077874]